MTPGPCGKGCGVRCGAGAWAGEGHLIMIIMIAKLMNWVLIPGHNSLYKIVANTKGGQSGSSTQCKAL